MRWSNWAGRHWTGITPPGWWRTVSAAALSSLVPQATQMPPTFRYNCQDRQEDTRSSVQKTAICGCLEAGGEWGHPPPRCLSPQKGGRQAWGICKPSASSAESIPVGVRGVPMGGCLSVPYPTHTVFPLLLPQGPAGRPRLPQRPRLPCVFLHTVHAAPLQAIVHPRTGRHPRADGPCPYVRRP